MQNRETSNSRQIRIDREWGGWRADDGAAAKNTANKSSTSWKTSHTSIDHVTEIPSLFWCSFSSLSVRIFIIDKLTEPTRISIHLWFTLTWEYEVNKRCRKVNQTLVQSEGNVRDSLFIYCVLYQAARARESSIRFMSSRHNNRIDRLKSQFDWYESLFDVFRLDCRWIILSLFFLLLYELTLSRALVDVFNKTVERKKKLEQQHDDDNARAHISQRAVSYTTLFSDVDEEKSFTLSLALTFASFPPSLAVVSFATVEWKIISSTVRQTDISVKSYLNNIL